MTRSISFTDPMIRAIWDKRRPKTQTRRPAQNLRVRLPETVRGDFPFSSVQAQPGVYRAKMNQHGAVVIETGDGQRLGVKPGEFHFVCPYIADGDTVLANLGGDRKCWLVTPRKPARLRVCEVWQAVHQAIDHEDAYFGPATNVNENADGYWTPIYRADQSEDTPRAARPFAWRSPRFMPTWASRADIVVSSARLEHLHQITEEDALAEGMRELPLQEDQPGAWWTADVRAGAPLHARTPVAAYEKAWRKMHGAGAWESDPWVWRVTFTMEQRRG